MAVRLAANGSTRPLITFLIVHGGLRAGYDYLLERKFSSIWREVEGCPAGADLAVFLSAAPFSSGLGTASPHPLPDR